MQDAGWLVFGAILAGIAAVTTGCSGVEIGGKIGAYRVDERQESQRTHRQPIPLKCYFTACSGEERSQVEGS